MSEQHVPCCDKGSQALSMTDAYAGGAVGYDCPDHGWRWVGETPLCECTPRTSIGPCDGRADGPDLLCAHCRERHRAAPAVVPSGA